MVNNLGGRVCRSRSPPGTPLTQDTNESTPKNSFARLGKGTEVPDWLQHVPANIRTHLLYEESYTVEILEDTILLLYAGNRDVYKRGIWWRSIDEKIEQINQRTAKKLFPVDIERNKRTQNMLAREPFNSLCTAAEQGKLQQVAGAPNCRTWSVLRMRPMPSGKGKPCRGREEET